MTQEGHLQIPALTPFPKKKIKTLLSIKNHKTHKKKIYHERDTKEDTAKD